MYVCLECEHLFEEPKKYYGEQLEYFGEPCRETFLVCPKCGEAYAKTYVCDKCGDYIVGDYYKDDEDGERYCEHHLTHWQLGREL